MAGFTGTKTQEDIKKNEENKKKKIEEKKNNTQPKTKSGWEKFVEGGRVDENDPNLIMSSGSGASIMEDDTRKKEQPKQEEPKKEQSLVADQFVDKKVKNWEDVLAENGNDPEKIMNWLNNSPGYKAGDLTKKGMAEFGYIQDADGKWVPKPKDETSTTDTTTNDYASEIEKLKKENEEFRKQLEELQNPKTGETDEEGAKSVYDEHMKKGLEMGAVTLDKDGNYVLTNVNKNGWEDWATIASAGLSVLGLAMGIPIIPINFRKITNKDKKDEAIREFQKQLTDISAGNLAKVKDVESSKEAGDYIKKNQDSIDAFTNYSEKVASYKAKSNIDTDSEKELIETRTDAQIRADEARFNNEMKRIKNDQDFQIKLEALREQYKEQFASLESALMTGSTKELLKYQNADMFKEMEEMGITPSKLAAWKASQTGISPADKIYNKIITGVNMVTELAETGVDAYATASTGGLNKLGQ